MCVCVGFVMGKKKIDLIFFVCMFTSICRGGGAKNLLLSLYRERSTHSSLKEQNMHLDLYIIMSHTSPWKLSPFLECLLEIESQIESRPDERHARTHAHAYAHAHARTHTHNTHAHAHARMHTFVES